MSIKKLFSNNQDFDQAVDKGLALTLDVVDPHENDLGDLKSLLAVLITAMIQLDPQVVMDPDLDKRLAGTRMALLAGYNLGRKRGDNKT